tara:strand:- start:244 stop:444 length:201 start_codon:yes stop_codon:yes gene_type:complete
MYRFLSTGKKILTPDKIPEHIFIDARNPEKNMKIRESIYNYMKTVTQISMSESHSIKPFIPKQQKL